MHVPHGSPCALLFFRRNADRLFGGPVWQPWEVEAARLLRACLLEASLMRMAAAAERGPALQGPTMAEMHHRTRNTLNLISALIQQGRADAGTIEDYADRLQTRIMALSDAFDMLNGKDRPWIGLRDLLAQTLGSYPPASLGRFTVDGPELDLTPIAVSTMVLVTHELAAHAVRDGAWTAPGGRVHLAIRHDETDGTARLVWREFGTAADVPAPGDAFGLRLLRDLVPYELGGAAHVERGPDGLVAEFGLPAGHVRLGAFGSDDTSGGAAPEEVERAGIVRIDGRALVLEDNLILSLEAAELLKSVGATHVHFCNTVDAALEALDEGDVAFALLDVNLNGETSQAVADQMWSDGIPAVLATGYEPTDEILSDFPPLPVVSKPYTLADIRKVLQSLHKA